MARGAGIGAQLADLESPVPGDARGDGKSVLGVVDRGRERAIEGKASMRVEDRRPGVDRARHGHGVDRVARDGGDAPRHERLERGARAGAAGAVVAPDRLPRHVQHAEAIAADAGHLRLDHAQHRDRGHRRVGCVTARAQRLDGGKARQRVRGRGHALAGDDRRAARQLKVAAHGDSRVPVPKFASPCGILSCGLRNQKDTSVPIPKFARHCGTLSCELRNLRDTSKLTILVCSDLKFLYEARCKCVGTSNPPH